MGLFKKKNPTYIKELNYFRMTKEVWDKLSDEPNGILYGSQKSGWEELNQPDNVYDLITTLLLNRGDGKDPVYYDPDGVFRLFTLDDEYLDWVGSNVSTQETLFNYAQSLSLEKRNEIMVKNKLNVQLSVYYIMVSSKNGSQESNFRLSERTCELIKEFFAKIYDSKVYCPGYIFDSNTAIKDHNKFRNIAKYYFEEGAHATVSAWERQSFDASIKNYFYLIPFAVYQILPSSDVKFEEICDAAFYTSHSSNMSLPLDGSTIQTEIGDYIFPKIRDSEAAESIIVDFGLNDLDICPLSMCKATLDEIIIREEYEDERKRY